MIPRVLTQFLAGIPAIVRTLAIVLALGSDLAAVHAAVRPPDNAREHWAFQPVRPVTIPDTGSTGSAQNPIDRFVLARLETAGIHPAPPADPRTLIRRLSLDLTGLPPEPAEVDRFITETARDRTGATGRLIDRLLNSPRHGERWGRHWLDVARYSDTKGYVYGREEPRFVHAPAYRDWVIKALNTDLPYDRFLLLQLAADQLVPADSTDLAALGFITGGRRFLGVTHDIIDDRIDVITRGTLGLTVACARCHDHKYDPIPTADYYSLYGVLRGNDDQLVTFNEPQDSELAALRKKFSDQMRLRRSEANARLRQRTGEYLAAQLNPKDYPEEGFDQILSAADIIPMAVRRWRDHLKVAATPDHPIFGPWRILILDLKDVPDPEWPTAAAKAWATAQRHAPNWNPLVAQAFRQPPTSRSQVAQCYGALFTQVDTDWKALNEAARTAKNPPPTQLPDPTSEALRRFLHDPASPTTVPDTGMVNTEYLYPTQVTEELWQLQGAVDRRLIALGAQAALMLAERPPEPQPVVFRRGSPSQAGPEVPRRFIEVLSGPDRRPFAQGNGRLELARAIASPDNPLTARVMVNRVWQHHFGTGLVKTPSDWGLRAEAPSHPELLDWLALRFVESGWSLKALHRLIVSSEAYQRASAGQDPWPDDERARLRRIDPDNRLLASFPLRRLDFEQLRDAQLAVTGELESRIGGSPSGLLDPSNQRRSVYGLVDRQFLPGVLRTFDFANPDLHVAVRHETTVPQQGLFFLNGPFAANRARMLARAVSGLSPEDRIRHLHRRLFQRAARPDEIAAGLQFVAEAERAPDRAVRPEVGPPEPRLEPWEQYAHVLLLTNEFAFAD
ncbi:MAG: DUF1549 and DUF1553 domain-containing protein [Verrucomicrobia bacterium]|nr:DUF1549 and DUF1553 domain-containing protein [Verrucomicrobiota bacterium]